MISRQVRIQLIAFALITALVSWYGAVRFLGVGAVVSPPYRVDLQVAESGGLYPRADVDLLGTRVGRVAELKPGPGTGTTVVLLIDHGVRISRDVRAAVAAKSAIGEGYVQLTPQSADGPRLRDGDVIPLSRSVSPIQLDQLLGSLDELARSVPLSDLDTLITESQAALDGVAPSVGRLISGSRTLADDALANLDDITALIRDARVVLTTQAVLAPQTRRWTRELADLLVRFRQLDPTVVHLYDTGLRATTGVTNLLADNQPVLPALLTNLVTLTTVAQTRIPQLRKTLAVFPWVLENQVNAARYCDDYDPRTGKAVASTCHYDDNGEPIYSLHLAQQLDKFGAQRFDSCTRGYEGTERYLPNGVPVDGTGGRQKPASEPNLRAGCTAPPNDPVSPNVRGAQNVTTPAWARPAPAARAGSAGSAGRLAVYDPSTGLVTDGSAAALLLGVRGDRPPSGPAGLAWLLTNLLEGS